MFVDQKADASLPRRRHCRTFLKAYPVIARSAATHQLDGDLKKRDSKACVESERGKDA
jgi:hypothetical protein